MVQAGIEEALEKEMDKMQSTTEAEHSVRRFPAVVPVTHIQDDGEDTELDTMRSTQQAWPIVR